MPPSAKKSKARPVASVHLLHWNEAECEERAQRIRRAGYRVTTGVGAGAAGLRALRDNPPDLYLIDLTRLPSQGRAIGVWLRQQKATRTAALVFVGGEPEKVAQTKMLLPDAVYAPWSRIRSALTRALEKPPREPVVPGTMEGYSGTPLPKKLGIKAASRVALLDAPKGFENTLGPLPQDVSLHRQARGRFQVVMLFVPSRQALPRRFPAAARAVAEGGRLWLVWPKKSSGRASDLGQNEVRAFGLERGFVDYKISAIDATWSGLCFARRKA